MTDQDEKKVFEFTFGKYKGKEVDYVIENDQSYVKWVVNQPFLNSEIKNYVKSKISLEYTINWGKYKGKSIKYIFNTDPKYIDWLKVNSYVIEKQPKILDEIKNLEN